MNKDWFEQELYLAYFQIYATEKCQHWQLCVLLENSIVLHHTQHAILININVSSTSEQFYSLELNTSAMW